MITINLILFHVSVVHLPQGRPQLRGGVQIREEVQLQRHHGPVRGLRRQGRVQGQQLQCHVVFGWKRRYRFFLIILMSAKTPPGLNIRDFQEVKRLSHVKW